MRKLLYMALTFLLLASCAGQRRHDAALRRAQAILNDAPDSALAILDSMEAFSSDFSRGTQMRWLLLRLSAQNKCDTVFRSDSLQLVLTNYFDRHGTPNERMMAHYLLGRAYSDMGEAPRALQCFQDAVACADSTSHDCDWWNLSRIYLQLAHECYETYMPNEMMEALQHSHNAALQAKDTMTSIIAIAKQYGVYELLEKKDSASIVTKEAVRLYETNGRNDLASQALSALIEDEVEKGNLEEASRLVKYYEGSSGYFDDNHEIESGREIYYYSKGVYYLGKGQTDSAEWVFKKLLQKAHDVNDTHAAYLGLRKKYLITGPKDSLMKYAILSESSNDSLYLENYKANIQLLQKRYNYSRHVENEQRLMLSGERKDKLLLLLVALFIVIAVVTTAILHNRKSKKEAMFKEYREDIERLQKLKSEMAGLINSKEVTIVKLSRESVLQRADIEEMRDYIFNLTEKLKEATRLTSEAISAKDEEIRQLADKYKDYEKFLVNKTMDDIVKTIRKSSIVQKLVFELAHPIHAPQNEEWDMLDHLFHEVHPNFPTTLQGVYKLTANEYRVCQLVFAGIPPKGIAVLMGFDKSNVTNIRKRLLVKMTGRNGKASEIDDFLFSIPLV